MSFRLVTMFLCMAALRTVVGLDCYRCTYLKIETSNKALQFVLEAFSKLSDDHCLFAKEEDKHEVSKRNCPQSDDGTVYKCVILNGTVHTSLDVPLIPSINFKYRTLTRDCVEVAELDDTTNDGCHTSLSSNGAAKRLLTGSLRQLNVGDVTYTGTACYYDHLTAAAVHVYCQASLIWMALSLLLSTFL